MKNQIKILNMKKIFLVALFAFTTTVLLGQSKKIAFKYTKTISSDSLYVEKGVSIVLHGWRRVH